MASTEVSAGEAAPASAGALLQFLRSGLPRTRSELARLTGLSRGTVATLIEQLVGIGLIAPTGAATSSGGRPPSQFALDTAGRSVLALDIGASHAHLAITDLGGAVLEDRNIEIDVAAGPEKVLSATIAAARTLLAEQKVPLAGVGVGLPGPVEFGAGRLVNPPIMPGWDMFDVRGLLESEFGASVYVDNDVNIMALGERTVAWPETNDLVFVKVATGIGSGIISGGDLRHGATGAAGDIGHAPVSRAPDVPCVCGNRGCLEAVASGRAILAALAAEGKPLATNSDLVAAVKSGDVTAIQALRQAGRDIGEVLSVAVPLLNPSVIVIGGSLSRAAEHLIAGVREVVYARAIPLSTAKLEIVASKTAPHAGVFGAASLVLREFLAATAINQLVLGSAAGAAAQRA